MSAMPNMGYDGAQFFAPDIITPEQVRRDRLPTEAPYACSRAPAGVLIHVHRDDGVIATLLTNRRGEVTFQKPQGIGFELELPRGGEGRYPSLVGFRPGDVPHRIPAHDTACQTGPDNGQACERVFVLVT